MTPFNDRYQYSVLELSEIWNEENYLKTIFDIEVRYIGYLRGLSDCELSEICWDSLSYNSIKKLELSHKHDIVAVCEYLKGKMSNILEGDNRKFVHFGLTSQDVVSLAYTLMVRQSHNLIFDKLQKITASYESVFGGKNLMGYTHGQNAVPIKGDGLIKMFKSFLMTNHIQPQSRFGNGACGGYFSQELLKDTSVLVASNKVLGYYRVNRAISRQTDFYPFVRKVMLELYEVSSFLKNESKNMWLYCMNGTLKQVNDPNQSGSSAMPQKINPIKFENAEANFTMASTNFMMIYDKIMESRLDRDLSDLSVMRNVGLGFAYLYQGIDSFIDGLSKVSVKQFELDDYSVFAEFVSMTLKLKTDIEDPYDLCKKMFKGKITSRDEFVDSINSLEIEEDVKEIIKKGIKDVARRR